MVRIPESIACAFTVFVFALAQQEDADDFRPASSQLGFDSFSELLSSGNETGSMLVSRSDIFGRQSRTCPYPIPCNGNQWCCPAGSNCCPQYLKCCETGSNCVPRGCCPTTAVTCGGSACAPPGSICCAGHVCPGGYQCNDNQASTCCAPGQSVCPGTCCPAGSICSPGRPGYCRYPRDSTSQVTRTTTSISTRTSISFSTSTGTVTRTSSSYGQCTPGLTPRKILEPRAPNPYRTGCIEACHIATREKVYIWEVPRIAGRTDQLVDSMCKGILARSRSGQVASGLNDGEDIIQYNGPGKGKRVTTVKCGGTCMWARTGLECDEYPPARWNQKTNTQTFLCIEGSQNSGTQGPMLSDMVRDCGMKAGDKMLVKVKGGCSYYNAKRDLESRETIEGLQAREVIELNGSNSTIIDPYDDQTLRYLAVNLGELANGHYDLRLNLEGTITNATVVDGEGEVLAKIDSPTGSTTLSFDVDEEAEAGRSFAVIAYTNEQTASVSVTGQGTTTNATGNSTAPPNTASSGSPLTILSSLIPLTLVALLF